MEILLTIGAALLYPGLLLTLVLGIVYAVLADGQSWRDSLSRTWRALLLQPGNRERIVSSVSIILAGFGLALLPWPGHPAPSASDGFAWLWAWLALETAFLLLLLPGMLSGSPPVARAASRALQIGGTGRALLWLALSVGLLLHQEWYLWGVDGLSPLIAHALALLAAVFAFPTAASRGAFAPETSITPEGIEQGLDEVSKQAMRAAHTICTAALLAASLVALLPTSLLPPLAGIPLILAAFCALCLVLRWESGRSPRLTLPGALRVCLWRALPPGVAAVIAMGLL